MLLYKLLVKKKPSYNSLRIKIYIAYLLVIVEAYKRLVGKKVNLLAIKVKLIKDKGI